jgi:alpha-tubulin suppressor-like RCC1 family protein
VSSDSPVAVEGVGGTGTLTGAANVTETDNGQTFCATLTSGGVDCWGYGAEGQVGDGTTKSSDVPVAVKGVGGSGTLSEVQTLYGNAQFFCALLTSGHVDCWGQGGRTNGYGDLGDDEYANSSTPVSVVSVRGTGMLKGVVGLSTPTSGYTGANETVCATRAEGGVDCWGYGGGLLGDGSEFGSKMPKRVKSVGGAGSLSGVESSLTGQYATCAVLTSGDIDCWGQGEYGTLGNGTTTSSSTPVPVLGFRG